MSQKFHNSTLETYCSKRNKDRIFLICEPRGEFCTAFCRPRSARPTWTQNEFNQFTHIIYIIILGSAGSVMKLLCSGGYRSFQNCLGPYSPAPEKSDFLEMKVRKKSLFFLKDSKGRIMYKCLKWIVDWKWIVLINKNI